MHIVDTNMILRYALKDHPVMYAKAQALLENEAITIPLEIVVEAVYVLEKVYHTERAEIQRLFLTLQKLLRKLSTPSMSHDTPENSAT